MMLLLIVMLVISIACLVYCSISKRLERNDPLLFRRFHYYAYSNGWDTVPRRVHVCQNVKRHRLESREVRPGVFEYVCEECRYAFRTDES